MHSVVCALNVYYLFDCRSGYVVLQREEQEHHTWLDGPVDGGPPGSAVLDRVYRLRQQARGQAGNRRWWSQVRVNHLCKLGSIKGVALGQCSYKVFIHSLGQCTCVLVFSVDSLKKLKFNISQLFVCLVTFFTTSVNEKAVLLNFAKSLRHTTFNDMTLLLQPKFPVWTDRQWLRL